MKPLINANYLINLKETATNAEDAKKYVGFSFLLGLLAGSICGTSASIHHS
jgi:hypothetical protein